MGREGEKATRFAEGVMRAALLLAALLTVSCASTGADEDDGPMPAPPGPSTDARLAELQTAMTELLERLDVLNERIARLEQGGTPAATPPSSDSASAASRPQTARALRGAQLADDYRNGLVLYAQKKYDDARRTFQKVFDADPSGDLADNALYWIGETYYVENDFNDSVRYYQRVINEYPDQNKAPDAMLKMALAQAKTGDLVLARRTLQSVIDRYPYSTAADSAKGELRRIQY